jgi:RNase H-like domain found in reverse transcriptase/Reverse transcriptase (RNA-dependent DNA polymerase)
MPFGLRNAGSTFQRLMDRVLNGLPFSFCYLDDIIAASKTQEQHVQHLRQLFEKLNSAGLVVNAEKCTLVVRTVDFLGHRITADGIQPLPDHVEAILNFPPPVKQLQAFLGIVNFYRRFVPGAANNLLPLTEFLKGSKSGAAVVDLSPEREAAFAVAKEKVAAATMLAHPVAGAELALAVDASDLHVGAVLQQREGPAAKWRPLGFFSKKLEPAQTRYSTFDRELYACFAVICLRGGSFVFLPITNP